MTFGYIAPGPFSLSKKRVPTRSPFYVKPASGNEATLRIIEQFSELIVLRAQPLDLRYRPRGDRITRR